MREINLAEKITIKKPFDDNSSLKSGGKKKDNTSKKKLENRKKEVKKITIAKYNRH